MPRVDIALPAYNAERFIQQTLDSISQQTYKNFKCFIVNDGSTDQTLKIITEHASSDDRFIVINRENRGMAACLNEINSLSQADYIARIDADDIMYPNRIETQLAYIEKHPETDVLASVGLYINDNGSTIGKIYSDFTEPRIIDEYYKNGNLVGLLHPSVMYNRKHVIDVGGYRGKFWPSDDVDLWARLYEEGRIIRVLNKPLLKYRIHSESAIASSFMQNRKQFRWARESFLARKEGIAEPNFADFSEKYKLSLNSKRKDIAKFKYRNAGFYLASRGLGKKMVGLKYLFGAFFFDPVYTLKKIRKQIVI